jgi:hypothetical protein
MLVMFDHDSGSVPDTSVPYTCRSCSFDMLDHSGGSVPVMGFNENAR